LYHTKSLKLKLNLSNRWKSWRFDAKSIWRSLKKWKNCKWYK